MTSDQLNSIFTYHAPHGDQATRYEALRAGGLQFAQLINTLAPESGEKTLAIRRVQEAVMFANAAIACNETAPAATPSAPLVCERCGYVIKDREFFTTTPDGRRYHQAQFCPAIPKIVPL